MSRDAIAVLFILSGAVLVSIWMCLLALSARIRAIEQRIPPIENEIRPRDGGIWHWSSRLGVRRCGNDLPNTSSTSVMANVTCSDCRRLMNVDRGVR